MFCSNCGAKNNDGAKFCNGCGSMLVSNASAPQAAPAPQVASVPQAVPVVPETYAPTVQPVQKAKKEMPEFIRKPLDFIKKSKPAKIGLIAGGAGLIVIIVLVLVVIVPLINKAEADAALQRYIDAQINLDAETAVNLLPPDYFTIQSNALHYQLNEYTENEIKEDIFNRTNRYWYPPSDWLKMEGDWSSFHTNYTIADSHTASSAELKELNDYLTEWREYTRKASGAVLYKVTVEFESRDRAASQGPYDLYIMCLNYNGKWYVIDGIENWRVRSGLESLAGVDWVIEFAYGEN